MSKAAPLSRHAGELVLRLLEQRRPVITAAALDDALPGVRPVLLASGALELHGTTRSVMAAGDDGPIFRELAPQGDRNEVGYFDAADGTVVVSSDDQRLLRVSVPWWLRWLADSLDLTNCGQPAELVAAHAWDIGDLWIDRHRKVPVIFVRRLHRDENVQALAEALKRRAGRGDPLVLSSGRELPPRSDSRPATASVSLPSVLTNDADTFAVDPDLLLSPYRSTQLTPISTGPLYLSPDGRLLVINGVEITFKTDIHVAIIRQLVVANEERRRVRARDVLEKAKAGSPTLQKAFGGEKWKLLRPYLRSKDGLWGFEL